MSQAPTITTADYQSRVLGGVARLWVDGVGAYLICFDNQVRIGGASSDPKTRAEISLMSNLSRHHARLIRSGEVWLLEPLAPTSIDGRPVARPKLLNDGNSILLGSSVKLKFRVPSPLTGTARLEFESSHRPTPSLDAVILLAETCVLGTGLDCHIPCRDGADRVLLTRRSSGLWCQAGAGVHIDGVAAGTEARCDVDRVYSGQNWRFRLESVG